MAHFAHVFSVGRCGTQFLARTLSQIAPDCHPMHEPGGAAFRSREVFRDPDAIYDRLGREPALQRLLVRIENQIRRGQTCISLSWFAFAWLPYFIERFGDDFRFFQLVRNPYDTAASHCTHDNNSAQTPDFLRNSRVYPGDRNALHAAIAQDAATFSPFEVQLFQWLEVHSYLAEWHDHAGFRGLFRFEDLFGSDPEPLNHCLSCILDHPVDVKSRTPFDRVHRGLVTDLGPVRPALKDAVQTLALRLGYDHNDLAYEHRITHLRARYRGKRFDLPCDPSLPVVDKTAKK